MIQFNQASYNTSHMISIHLYFYKDVFDEMNIYAWVDGQHCPHYKCHCLIINHNKLTIIYIYIYN